MTRPEADGDLRALLVLLRGRPDIRIDVYDASPTLLEAARDMGGEYGEGRSGSWVTIERRLVLFCNEFLTKEVA